MKLILASPPGSQTKQMEEDHEQQASDKGAAEEDAQGQHQPPEVPRDHSCGELRAQLCQGGGAGIEGTHQHSRSQYGLMNFPFLSIFYIIPVIRI